MGELAGRTALVTGAGNGLGRAIAVRLGKAGARVILTGRTVATLKETAALLPDVGQARIAAADVSSSESVTALRDALSAGAGPAEEIDLLVNNAGIGGPVKEITDIEPAEWDEVFAGCVRSVNFTREAAATGGTYEQAQEAFVSRAALHRLLEEHEVSATVLAMLRMPGLCGADIDLSAGMIAPA